MITLSHVVTAFVITSLPLAVLHLPLPAKKKKGYRP